MKTLAFLWICLLFATAGQARTIFVDANVTGANNGTSWADAYNHLQDGLADANSAAKPVEIHVAQGIYTPAEPSGDRMATFQLITGVAIRGGYAGFGESEPDARDIDAYQAILSGDLNGDDDGFTNNAENSFHIATGSYTDQTAILDGFTITAGNADGSNYWDPNSQGGGMYNYQGSPTVSNCTFSGNSASWGGGMFNWHSSPTVTGCAFSGNTTTAPWDTGMGGGVYNYESSEPTLTNCTFSGNSADWGGGMANDFSSPMVTGCTFSDNSAYWCGGGTFNGFCSPTLVSCTFTGNSARSGGGMANNGGSPTLTGCEFSGNTATDDGGAMYSHSASNPTLTGCTFIDNSAYASGGAMCNNDSSSPAVSNCEFTGNVAETNGGGMCNEDFSSPAVSNCEFTDNVAEANGGGMCSEDFSSPVVSNCEFTDNVAVANGGAVYAVYNHNDLFDVPTPTPTLTNCIFTGNLALIGGAVCHQNEYFFGPYHQNICSLEVKNCVFTGNSAYSAGALGCLSSTPDYWPSTSVQVINCTFNQNHATESAGAIWCDGPSEVTVNNCILWGDSSPKGPEIAITTSTFEPSTMTIQYSDVQGAVASAYVEPGCVLNWQAGNIDVQPDFAFDDDLHLTAGSPCIDTGDNSVVEPNSTDLAGNPRIIDGDEDGEAIVDMGAYEFVPAIEIEADLRVVPRVINRKSRGRYVMAVMRLPEGIAEEDIDTDEGFVLEPADLEAIRWRTAVYDERVRVFVLFDRARLMDAVSSNGEIELTVSGQLESGQGIYGVDTIRIIGPPREHPRGRGRGRPYRR